MSCDGDRDRGRIYYDCLDEEVMTETDPGEAIRQYLEWFDSAAEFPEEVTARAFVPVEVTEAEKCAWAIRLVEWLKEEADQDHLHHEFDTLDKKQIAVLEVKARVFVEEFFKEYRGSMLTAAPEHNITVDVHEWVSENEPDWLEDE